MTECKRERLDFQASEKRRVEAAFDGGHLSSDGGLLFVRELENRVKILKRFAGCFYDHRDPGYVEHPVEDLVKQRVFALACGYEDVNDHDHLNSDVLLALACGKADPEGRSRIRARDRGKALAGKSTMCRMELGGTKKEPHKDKYKKIVLDFEKAEKLLLDIFEESLKDVPDELVLDLDATDDPLHGNQEGAFFNGYYKAYCYLPLYIFCGDHLLLARLQTSDVDPAKAGMTAIRKTVRELRRRFPKTRLILRGDGGFCREELMDLCESPMMDFVFGLPKNKRLEKLLESAMSESREKFQPDGEAVRTFSEFSYKPLETWEHPRRVIGKAEINDKGENPRFVVTTMKPEKWEPKELYEDFYCARGDMENRIKEQQLGLFGDRLSTSWIKSNQLRLFFSSFAHTLFRALREDGLKGTRMEKAQCWTMRTQLMKIAVRITLSVRRIKISFPTPYPYKEMFHQVLRQIRQVPIRC